MKQKTIIITGATGGIGSAAVRALVSQGYGVVLACRNMVKAEALRCQLPCPEKAWIAQLELTSLASVRRCAEEIRRIAEWEGLTLTGLFNNAGVLKRRFSVTEDGLEQTIAVNCVAPWVFTRALLPVLASEANIVNMVSLAIHSARLKEDFLSPPSHYRQLRAYANSKMALLLASVWLAGQLPQWGYENMKVNVSDPGIVDTNLLTMERWFDPLANALFRPLCKRPQQGVIPSLRALETEATMHFFVGNRSHAISKHYTNHPLLDVVASGLEGYCTSHLGSFANEGFCE
jgi:NAD(P)-dependent dehydrogenase (short-subunit alcohol dehydrogenase family)